MNPPGLRTKAELIGHRARPPVVRNKDKTSNESLSKETNCSSVFSFLGSSQQRSMLHRHHQYRQCRTSNKGRAAGKQKEEVHDSVFLEHLSLQCLGEAPDHTIVLPRVHHGLDFDQPWSGNVVILQIIRAKAKAETCSLLASLLFIFNTAHSEIPPSLFGELPFCQLPESTL